MSEKIGYFDIISDEYWCYVSDFNKSVAIMSQKSY